MSLIPDEKLFEHADRVTDAVVVITGAANGIGRETAIRFAGHGAKVVIGDMDFASATKVVGEIESSGGQAVCINCNVTIWDDLVALFELAMSRFGSVDIVVANAGVTEIGDFGTVRFENGKPVKPTLRTLEVNLIAVMHTVHLAQHYLLVNRKENQLKAIVLLGSMASWQAFPKGETYCASKHAILGLMRSLHIPFERQGIRVAVIHPFFADTGIVPASAKLLLAGIPLTPVPRIAGAIFYAATNPDPATNGAAWLLPDNGPVFLVPKEEFKLGVYKMIDDRANFFLAGTRGVTYYARMMRDVWRVVGKPVVFSGLAVIAAKLALDNQESIRTHLQAIL